MYEVTCQCQITRKARGSLVKKETVKGKKKTVIRKKQTVIKLLKTIMKTIKQ